MIDISGETKRGGVTCLERARFDNSFVLSDGARPVPVSWPSFGVAAASVTDVYRKTFISSIEVEFNMASGRATASLLNGVAVTRDKQAAVLRDTILGQ